MTQPQQQLQPHHSLKLQNNGMNRLSRVFLIPLTTLVCTKILILSLFYEQYPHQFQRSSNNNKKEAGNLRDNRPLIVSEMRFELTRANAHYPLKVACLPIPPPGHIPPKDTDGAKNGTRTRDPNLGKVVLYQLSYFRNCECKDSFTFRFMQMVY